MIEKKEVENLNFAEKEIFAINLLRNFLFRMRISANDYSILQCSDCAYCIEKENGLWKIFYYEMGIKYFTKEFDDVIPACLKLVEKFKNKINDKDFAQFKESIEELYENDLTGTAKIKKLNNIKPQ